MDYLIPLKLFKIGVVVTETALECLSFLACYRQKAVLDDSEAVICSKYNPGKSRNNRMANVTTTKSVLY